MLMWFKPYGHVVEMRLLEDDSEQESLTYLVQMSCLEEAMNAYKALHGKSIMRGAASKFSP